MNDKPVYQLQAEICKALGNPTRIEVIEMLQDEELCFSDILENTGGLKSTLSQNLSVMVSAGLIKMRKDSRCNYYSLTSPKAYKACRLMREVLINNLEKQMLYLLKSNPDDEIKIHDKYYCVCNGRLNFFRLSEKHTKRAVDGKATDATSSAGRKDQQQENCQHCHI